MTELKLKQEEFEKHSITDIAYEVESEEVYIEYYNNEINSGGCLFIDLPKHVNNIEEFIAEELLNQIQNS